MRKTVAVVSLTAALSLAPAAAAQAHEAVQKPVEHVAVQPTPDPNQNDDGGSNTGLNGLWGLLGLAGLLGLIPRRPKAPETNYGTAERPAGASATRTEARERTSR